MLTALIVSVSTRVRNDAGGCLTSGERILEDLLETQELQDTEVDGGVQTETTLVRAKGRVELDTESTVHLDVALVILPNNTELDDALRDGSDLEGLLVFGVLLEQGTVLKSGGKLCGVVLVYRSIHQKSVRVDRVP